VKELTAKDIQSKGQRRYFDTNSESFDNLRNCANIYGGAKIYGKGIKAVKA
jgi:hypothetical protein